ncbi:uncharacterized protein PHACADRAFT_149497 [Phanerochaete carnosa HHB-10118-sp]|uniref:Pentacotripeptide-repeat region of PRORP domain-containing protein n=1 Tax=Phanerochaete carnosa (strain HHB-10118-sp) TaxID=650164 RepID=K5URY2_PHACS|nr:uncharacterized protein PHACADRAFT_149497 [Phanerochaete carnosa HHB-10118-sp]EKM52656.1 hypothetical protein PHACADRAFT_149497 [Phanerochaete carnosa HHB-10118-sp]
MSGIRLPSGLVDLVLARTSTSAGRAKAFSGSLWQATARRQAHSAVVLRPRILSPEYEQDKQSLYATRTSRKMKEKRRAVASLGDPQPRAVSTLEERVNALKNTMVSEEDLETHEFYDEEQLLAVYEDLLALPKEGAPDTQTTPIVKQPEEDSLPIVNKIAERLLPDISEPSTSTVAPQPVRHALIKHLEHMQTDLEAVEAAMKKSEPVVPSDEPREFLSSTPVVLVTQKEWIALVAHCVREHDTEAAERVLALMKRSRCDTPEESFNIVLAVYAEAGDIERADQFVSKFLSTLPTELQRDLHIQAHLKAVPQAAFPRNALRALHDYEGRALAPSQKTYSRLITRLLSAGSSVAHAHAWDLFSHMRYVAHPKPDALMYTTMIRACASPSISSDGEPERALDLFIEMTIDNDIPPTAGAYTATILACARSGRAKYVHEGLRLAKEMMDAHRDAYGHSQFMPGRSFFSALLEGAKRIGDLPRVRWILAEMVRESLLPDAAPGDPQVDPHRAIREEAMLHIFHTYAAYRTPYIRSLAPKAPEVLQKARPQDASPISDVEEEISEVVAEPEKAFSRLPPQSHAEVIHEAKMLFSQLLDDSRRAEGVFAHVQLTPRLLNAYLSVHYRHSPIETWRELFQTVHTDVGVSRNAYSYVEVLERCAIASKAERPTALRFAEGVFPEWCALEDAWRAAGPLEVVANARLIERAHAAMIRVLALTNNVQRAVEAIKAFVAAYPPTVVCEPAPRPEFRSTRTNLLGARPLVRMFNVADIPDDSVPPLLSFTELELLHHRLVVAGRATDIRYLKWVCKEYEGSLRRRRERALQATMHPVYKPQPLTS